MNRAFWGRRGLLGLGSASVALGLGSGGLEPVTGTGSATVSPASASGSGELSFSTSSATAVWVPGASGSGALSADGSGSAAVSPVQSGSFVTLAFDGSGTATLASIAVDSAGALAFDGAGTAALYPVQADALGALAFDGSGWVTVSSPLATGSGFSWFEPRQGRYSVTVVVAETGVVTARSVSSVITEDALSSVTTARAVTGVSIPSVNTGVTAVTYYIRLGDSAPTLNATLEYNKAAYDLTQATQVQLRYRAPGSTTYEERECSIIGDPTLGVVEYSWVDGDLLEPGVYVAEWVVYKGAGFRLTFPNGPNAYTITVTRSQ